jgi:heterodisulfide reductase subunit C
MAKLKQIAAHYVPRRFKASTFFYRDFMESVRRHGRVNEMELMTHYFTHMKNPLLPFKVAPLGLKLIAKGKLSLQLPSYGKGKLEALFEKVAEMEKVP